jgi:hypothetical protein
MELLIGIIGITFCETPRQGFSWVPLRPGKAGQGRQSAMDFLEGRCGGSD